MIEATTSTGSSFVGSARLEAVAPAPPPEGSAGLDRAQWDVVAQVVRQARDTGTALTRPDGLLKALAA
ncbi:hypothetical protein [Actinomyces respiraculi]|uniref:hypothetical protein n=1 Tax=Actinomyces respiraculi TaxID=2744574 RepID=UPI001421A01A|nr:hypothetical protein [Actinomyces respiraculi]